LHVSINQKGGHGRRFESLAVEGGGRQQQKKSKITNLKMINFQQVKDTFLINHFHMAPNDV
jgi:hypothetical protein